MDSPTFARGTYYKAYLQPRTLAEDEKNEEKCSTELYELDYSRFSFLQDDDILTQVSISSDCGSAHVPVHLAPSLSGVEMLHHHTSGSQEQPGYIVNSRLSTPQIYHPVPNASVPFGRLILAQTKSTMIPWG